MRRVVTEMRLRRETQSWTRADVAAKLQLVCSQARSIDADSVKRWELRRHTPYRVFRPHLCRLFGACNLAELGLGDHWPAWSHWTLATDGERAAEVKRRKLLEAGVAVAGAALLPRAPGVLGPGKVDAGWLREAERVTTSLATLYRAVPPGQLSGSVHGHLGMLVGHLGAPRRPADRLRLHRGIADVAAFAGWIELRLDRFEAAGHCFDLAEIHALQADDRTLQAQVLGCQSQLQSTTPTGGRRGDARRALALVERAIVIAGTGAPLHARGRLLGRLAEERAANGDPVGCARALEGTGDLLSAPLDISEGGFFGANGYYATWDPAYFDAFTATCDVQLGKPGAVDVLARTAREVTAPERTATVLADLAAGYARAGDPEFASSTLRAAFEQAVRVGYPLGVERVLGVRSRFDEGWDRHPAVRELDERLRPGSEHPEPP